MPRGLSLGHPPQWHLAAALPRRISSDLITASGDCSLHHPHQQHIAPPFVVLRASVPLVSGSRLGHQRLRTVSVRLVSSTPPDTGCSPAFSVPADLCCRSWAACSPLACPTNCTLVGLLDSVVPYHPGSHGLQPVSDHQGNCFLIMGSFGLPVIPCWCMCGDPIVTIAASHCDPPKDVTAQSHGGMVK